jgi:hypothetical protein
MALIVRILAALLLPVRIADLIVMAQRIVAAMTNNSNFPNPPKALTDVTQDIQSLSLAQQSALGRGKGAAQARNLARRLVISDLRQLQSYVQVVADAAGSIQAAEVIITSAAMNVRKTAARTKAPLDARHGGVSGAVLLIAKALADRASYQWSWSSDGKSWVSLPTTLQARTMVSGLTAGTVYYFRVRGVLKTGETDWSQTVALLVQ